MISKVNLLVCGVQKGGTSSLHEYLSKHPKVFMSKQKELHFFDNEKIFSSIPVNINFYHQHFNFKGNYKFYGESTPIYFYWNQSPFRIFSYNPDVKIIILLRNPIERAFSHWKMEFRKNNDSLNFTEAIKNENKRIKIDLPFQHRIYSYIDRGFYFEQIRRLKFYFKVENILFIKSESFFSNPQNEMNKIFDFLDLDRINFNSFEIHNASNELSLIQTKDKDFLRNIFYYDIKNVERELNWDCTDWTD